MTLIGLAGPNPAIALDTVTCPISYLNINNNKPPKNKIRPLSNESRVV